MVYEYEKMEAAPSLEEHARHKSIENPLEPKELIIYFFVSSFFFFPSRISKNTTFTIQLRK